MPELEDEEIQIGDKKIGGNTLIKFDVKTMGYIFGILYVILGYLYFDLRQELKESVNISTEEKIEFLRDVEDDWKSKLDNISEITTQIRVDQAGIKGDIKIILDRQQRNNTVQPNTSINVIPVQPPGN